MSENTLTVTDNHTGKTYEIPIEHDTIPATALRKHTALHAEQLAAINTIFAPLPDATAHARAVVAAVKASARTKAQCSLLSGCS